MKSPLKFASALLNRVRNKTSRESRKSYEQESLGLLAENCGDVIFRFGVDGQARYISPSVERLYGRPLREIYAMGGNVVENGFIYEDDCSPSAPMAQIWG